VVFIAAIVLKISTPINSTEVEAVAQVPIVAIFRGLVEQVQDKKQMKITCNSRDCIRDLLLGMSRASLTQSIPLGTLEGTTKEDYHQLVFTELLLRT